MLPSIYSNSRNSNGFIPSLFNDFFNDRSGLWDACLSKNWLVPQFHTTAPAINVSEDDKEYKVEVAAPGMTKDDFKISLSDDDIVISMEKKSDTKDERSSSAGSAFSAENKDKKYLRREFFTLYDLYRSSGEQARNSYSKFEQHLTLPENVERQNISAQMTDGVLCIDLPKMTPQEKAMETQYIEIK